MRVTFFAWSTALEKILTIDNLRKRHVLVVDWCCVFERSGMSVDHLLLHCEIAMALWNAFFSCIGLAWVIPRRVVDFFACWRGKCGSLQSAAVWKMVPSSLMWCFWRERYDRSFENRERMVVELKCSFFNTLYHWTTALDNINLPMFLDFLSHLDWVYLLYTFCVLGLRLCAFLIIFRLLIY